MAWLFSKKLMDSASLPCSQEQVAEYSAENSSDGEQCALWNGTHTPRASWLPAKMTDACRLSRSGMTFKPLTDDLGEAVLMSFLEDFPAKTSQPQEKELALTESDHPCGSTWRELSVKFDRNTSSWKTHRCLWEEDLPESSVTLPKWGMMQNGVCLERTTLMHPIKETGFGSWGMPETVQNNQVKQWPTPTANEDAAGTPEGKMQWMLTHAAKTGCTTRSQYELMKDGNAQSAGLGFLMDARTTLENGSASNVENGHTQCTMRLRMDASTVDQAGSLAATIGGQLNPNWVEWLMGFPIGWTDSNPLAMHRFQQWQLLHGKS